MHNFDRYSLMTPNSHMKCSTIYWCFISFGCAFVSCEYGAYLFDNKSPDLLVFIPEWLWQLSHSIKHPLCVGLTFIIFNMLICSMYSFIRMQDIELMHMRYALESIVIALGVMERSMTDERGSHYQAALCHLKDLRNHLEAITNIPRKVALHENFPLLFYLFFGWEWVGEVCRVPLVYSYNIDLHRRLANRFWK